MSDKRPEIDDYQVPLGYLQDLVAWFKASSPHFSLRSFAEKSGYKTHTQLLKILKGQAVITLEVGTRLARGLDLDEAESKKWLNLVRGDQVTHVDTLPLSPETAPIDTMVLALMNASSARNDPEWFAEVTRGLLSVGEAQDVLARLIHAGVARWDDGEWKINETFLAAQWGVTPDQKDVFCNSMNQLVGRMIRHRSIDYADNTTFIYLDAEMAQTAFKEIQSTISRYDKPDEARGDLYVVNLVVSQIAKP